MVKPTSSLLLSGLLLATLASADLGVPNQHDARQHGRMIRKRQVGGLFGPQPGPVENPGGSPPASESPSSTGAAPAPPDPTSTAVTSSKPWDPLGGLTSALGGIIGPHTTTTTTTTMAVSATSSSFAAISLSPTTTSSSTSTTVVTTESHSTKTIISVATLPAPAQGESNPSAATSRQVGIARKTIVALVAVAGSIGIAFLIWTAIRKWKFRASRGLEDRNNINWNPDADVAGYNDVEEKVSRRGRPASEMSFGSHDGLNAHGGASMYGSTAVGEIRPTSGYSVPANRTLDYDLQHDFTAGPTSNHQFYNDAHPAAPAPAVSVTSSSPPMVENNLTRGPSLTRSVSRNDDPYGGYEDAYDDGLAPHHGAAGANVPNPHPASSGLPPAHQF